MLDLDILKAIISKVLANMTDNSFAAVHPQPIPLGVSNRHIHLSQKDLEGLFGEGYKLHNRNDLSQPGQFAAVETVIIAGPKGALEKVRILGPVRKQSQVEISQSDAYKLGLSPSVRESGDLKGTGGLAVIGPKGSVQLNEGLIIAKRHIHMTPADASFYGVSDSETVSVRVGGERGLTFDQVVIRVSDRFALDFHIDMDEANACGARTGDKAFLIKRRSLALPDNHSVKLGNTPGFKAADEPVRLVTDELARNAWKSRTPLLIEKNALITPLARDTIKELGVEVIVK